MEKTLTLKVPNELWVNDFSQNKTTNYTYTGPDRVWLIVEVNTGTVFDKIYETKPDADTIGDKELLEINISTASEAELAAVIGIKTKLSDAPYVYTYVDQTNHDGSIYKAISNPTIFDYYSIKYVPVQGILLEPIYKDPTNANMPLALERKNYVEKFANAFDFESADAAKITAFLTNINTYISTISTAYPWKFISVDKNEVPKIPVSLVSLFSTLPSLT